jgi:3-oxoadipate enol-lactonase
MMAQYDWRQVTTADGVALFYGVRTPTPKPVPRVVLIHSLALDHTFWNPVSEAVAGDMALLAIDCRGHGRSGQSGDPFTVERMADDLAAVLDDVGWDRAVIAGCSMGGCVAMAFAARYPTRTAGLVVIDTRRPGPGARPKPVQEAWRRCCHSSMTVG